MSDALERNMDGEEINLRHLFLKLFSRWKYYVISFVILIAVGFGYMKFSDPIYEAETSILIKDNKYGTPGNIEDFLNADLFSPARNLSSEIGILQSRSVLF